MKAQNPSKSLGEGRDVAPSLAHPSQKQTLVVYTKELTHLFEVLPGDPLPASFDECVSSCVNQIRHFEGRLVHIICSAVTYLSA